MTNLHYENLPDVRLHPQALMARTLYELDHVSRYLKLAKEWLLEQILKLAWEDEASLAAEAGAKPDGQEGGGAGAKPEEWSGWVLLKEADADEPPDTFQEFYDAEWVSDDLGSSAGNIRVLDVDPLRGALKLSRRPQKPFLHLKPNTYPLDCQRRALWRLQNNPDPHHVPLLRLVEDVDRAWWPEVRVPGAGFDPEYVEAEEDEEDDDLDESGDGAGEASSGTWHILRDASQAGTQEERRFVHVALNTPDLAILEGPPGSGKTITICELILQELERGRRVLLCASTHVAVDNVLENLIDLGYTKTKVIAVRIGDASRVSERVKPLQLEERLRTERRELVEKLSSLKKRTPAQEHLLRALESEENEALLRIVLECSNLVCGTTIGILQHPDIKRSRSSPGYLFDTLIIDEASKTTFQEFLVPAVLAKKWILVGDVRQLSPYVDEGFVEANIRGILPPEDGDLCLRMLTARRSPVIVAHKEPSRRQWYAEQAQAIQKPLIRLEGQPGDPAAPPPLEVMGSHVVIADPAVLPGWEAWIPSDFENLSDVSLPLLDRRRAYRNHAGAEFEQEPTSWAREVSWRLIRTFELRDKPEQRKNYEAHLEALVPRWYPPGRRDEVHRNLDLVRKVAFPSVIELLQRGFERRPGQRGGTALTDGLPGDVLARRHVRLVYQHRMHPDISKFPREHIYDSEALKDPANMASRRGWKYPRYSHRSVWIDVRGEVIKGRNENPSEAEQVLRELREFMSWARNNRKDPKREDEPWEVALLAFYRPQEGALRQRLRSLFQSRARQTFEGRGGNVRVVLGTVDRFQGHEADIVLLSFVRNRRTGVGFLDSPNRLNVALTRARYQRVLIGDHAFFGRQARSELLRELAAAHRPEIAFARATKPGLRPAVVEEV